MKKIAFVIAAVGTLAVADPAFAQGMDMRMGDRDHHRGGDFRSSRIVVMHRDHGRHEGWQRSRHHVQRERFER